MDERDDPYEILGISRDATEQQIKTAYRKAALKHHPDKQRTEADKERAHQQFAKISNAYELLSDKAQRRIYDQEQDHHHQQQQHSAAWSGQDDGASFFHQHHNPHFHDPFQVFERVFREEFGRGGPFMNDSFRSTHDPFMMRNNHDPFMAGGGDPFGSMFGGGLFGGGLFGGGLFGGGMFGDTSRGRDVPSRRDPFEEMFDSMRRMHDSSSHVAGGGGGGNGRSFTYSSSSSSSSNRVDRDGSFVTTKTTTKVINGKQQTVTERIVRKADGTVERHVETSGDEDFPSLDRGPTTTTTRGYLEQGVEQHPPPTIENETSKKRQRRGSRPKL